MIDLTLRECQTRGLRKTPTEVLIVRRFIVRIVSLSAICFTCLLGCSDSVPTSSLGPNTQAQTNSATSNGSRPAKLGLCAGCHGDTGKAILADYPNLAGQNQRYLASSLRAYKNGERRNSAMRAMVGTLTEAEIDELALYYANSAGK